MNKITASLFFLLALSISTSCKKSSKKGITINFSNDSQSTIKDIHLSTSEGILTLKRLKLKKGDSFKCYLPMDNNRLDGSYSVKFSRANGKRDSLNAGYYTLGVPFDSKMVVKVDNDTTIVSLNNFPF